MISTKCVYCTVHAVSRWLHIILSVHTDIIRICNITTTTATAIQFISSPFTNMTWYRRTFDQLMEVLQYTQWQDTNSKHCSKQELTLENEGTFHKWNCCKYTTNKHQKLICDIYVSTFNFILGLYTAESAAKDCSEIWMTYCIKCYWVKWEEEGRRKETTKKQKESWEGKYRWKGLVIRMDCIAARVSDKPHI